MFWICFDCQSVKGNNSKYQRRCYQLCKLRMRVGTIPFIPIALPDGWDDELPSRCTNVTWDTPPSLSCVALRSNRMHQSFHWTLLWKMHPRMSWMPSKVINQNALKCCKWREKLFNSKRRLHSTDEETMAIIQLIRCDSSSAHGRALCHTLQSLICCFRSPLRQRINERESIKIDVKFI